MEYYKAYNHVTRDYKIVERRGDKYFTLEGKQIRKFFEQHSINFKCTKTGKIVEISVKSEAYKAHRAKKCKCCGTTEELTVHHSVPKDVAILAGQTKYLVKDLVTLCNSCHNEYTTVENKIKGRMHRIATPSIYQIAKSKLTTLRDTTSPPPENTKKKLLTELSFFFRRDLTDADIPNLEVVEQNYMDGMDYEKVAKFWRSHLKNWLEEYKIIEDLKQINT